MLKYESVLILKSDLNKTEQSNIIERIENKINSFGKVTKKQIIGNKKLAYEVKHYKIGYYICYEFEIMVDKEREGIPELERLYRMQDEILKFIVIRK